MHGKLDFYKRAVCYQISPASIPTLGSRPGPVPTEQWQRAGNAPSEQPRLGLKSTPPKRSYLRRTNYRDEFYEKWNN